MLAYQSLCLVSLRLEKTLLNGFTPQADRWAHTTSKWVLERLAKVCARVDILCELIIVYLLLLSSVEALLCCIQDIDFIHFVGVVAFCE